MWSSAKVEMLNPSQQPSRWLREIAQQRYGLYMHLGREFPGATYLLGHEVRLREDLLFGLGRATDVVDAPETSHDDLFPIRCDNASTSDTIGSGAVSVHGVDEGIGAFHILGCSNEEAVLMVVADGTGTTFRSVSTSDNE